ncbi:MAG: ATP-dependent Clp protease ATP-binding subunit [Oscillospiraceae bacterium]|nr:ATP-dependent Clp protease ATP-binding subunit [Oscillospiraceae bacterium]
MLCSRCKQRPAVMFITKVEGDKTSNEGLCLVCAKELGLKPVDDILKKFGISDDDIESFSEQMGMISPGDEDDFEQGGTPTFPSIFGNLFNNQNKNSSNDEKKNTTKKDNKFKYLSTYCDNLTQKAKDGKLDSIIGREKEISRTVQILCRRQKNNPCLIGEAGVGKTAIAEGIALQIASGNVPEKLKDKEVYLLDLTALVAGTQFRGQFESRVKGLINEVVNAGNIILFIDEVHNLTGAGDADGAMSASNILKPALSRGEIQVIGATTFAEYRKYIEKDQALERRFQPVKVEEPSIEECIDILLGIKKYYEDFHHVKVSESIIQKMVVLSERYISDRYLPDKAIDLLDEACTCASLESDIIKQYLEICEEINDTTNMMQEANDSAEPDYENIARMRSELIRLQDIKDSIKDSYDNVEVTTEHVAYVIELWTGIPSSFVKTDEISQINNLEASLREKIIGQDEAVSKVVKAIKRTRLGLNGHDRPASFIFVGPTGVGKTELAKVIGYTLFDKVDPIIRIDMSEYMEKHTVSKLIGSPPGYVGYDEAGQLTEKVRRRPYSVVLFDEIEKAHPDVLNILLQILDDGKITDSQGRTVNFEHTIIIMTSNAGSNEKTGLAGFGQSIDDKNSDKMLKALKDFLRPEFMARVDEIIVFKSLSDQDMEKIAELMIKDVSAKLIERNITLSYNIDILNYLVQLAGSRQYGARDLRQTIRREIEDKITDLILENNGDVSEIIVDIKDNALTFTTK